MDNKPSAVYNLTRRALVNNKLTVTDCSNQPLRILNLVVNGLGLDSVSGLWLVSLHGTPGVPRVFPFDLIYLDQDYRVVETAEIAPGIEFPVYRREFVSALVVPQNTLNISGTRPGDRLMICPAEELESLLVDEGGSGPVDEGGSGAVGIELKPEEPLGDRVFSNWIASPSQLPSAIAPGRSVSAARAPVPEPLQKPRPPRRESVSVSGNGSPAPRMTEETVINRKAEATTTSRVPVVKSNSAPATPSQKSRVPADRESRPSGPPRAGSPKPTRSTTTFATSSLPMWHVSAPTAIAPGSGAIQSSSAAISHSGAAPSRASSGLGNGKESATQAGTLAEATAKESTPAARDRVESAEGMESNVRPVWRTDGVGSEAHKEKQPAVAKAPVPQSDETFASNPSKIATRLTGPAQRLAQGRDPKWSPQSSQSVAKNDTRSSLGMRFKQWLHPVSKPSDRRRAERRYIPGVVAHYFTGGAPKPHMVADISLTGFYMLTDDRWMTGTMIQMTMQRPSRRGGDRKQSITVLGRIVRRGSDGVGAEFVMPESIDSHSHDIQPSQATDRIALAQFL